MKSIRARLEALEAARGDLRPGWRWTLGKWRWARAQGLADAERHELAEAPEDAAAIGATFATIEDRRRRAAETLAAWGEE